MKEEVEFLLRRAEVFKRDAKYDFENNDFDVCMFHIEQAAPNLLVKAKLWT